VKRETSQFDERFDAYTLGVSLGHSVCGWH
jgi:hypothetical protein